MSGVVAVDARQEASGDRPRRVDGGIEPDVLPAELIDQLGLLRLSTRQARRPGLVADGPTHPTQGMHRTSAVQVPIKTAFRRSQQPVVG